MNNPFVGTLPAQLHLNGSNGTVIGLLLLIAQIIVIVSLLTGTGSAGHEVLWTLLVLLLPILGLILYFLVGRNKQDRPLLKT